MSFFSWIMGFAGGGEDDEEKKEEKDDENDSEKMRRMRLARFDQPVEVAEPPGPIDMSSENSSPPTRRASPSVGLTALHGGSTSNTLVLRQKASTPVPRSGTAPEGEAPRAEGRNAWLAATEGRGVVATPDNKPTVVAPPRTSSPAGPASATSPSSATAPKTPEVPGKFINDFILSTLQISLTGPAKNATFLDDLAAELKDENDGELPFLTGDQLDRVIYARLSRDPPQHSTHFGYLVARYGATRKAMGSTVKDKYPERVEVMEAMLTLCVSYAGLTLKFPDMFPSPPGKDTGPKLLFNLLTGSPDSLPPGFLGMFVERFENDELELIFVPVLLALSSFMSKLTLADAEHVVGMRVFSMLCQYKAILDLLPKLPTWTLEDGTGKDMETRTFIGPFFSLSPVRNEEIQKRYYDMATVRFRQPLAASHSTLRGMFTRPQEALRYCLKALLKVDREAVLSWVASCAERNVERRKTVVNYNTTSSDGFLLNLGSVLVGLCEPFMDPSKNMIQKIDGDYLMWSGRFNVTEDTKFVASTGETDAWVDRRNEDKQQQWADRQRRLAARAGLASVEGDEEQPAGSADPEGKYYGLVTELFFLTGRTLNVGLLSSIKDHGELLKRMSNTQRMVNEIEMTRGNWLGTPTAMQMEFQLKHAKEEMDTMFAVKASFEGHILDPTTLSGALRYYSFVCRWLIKLVDPEGTGLPLPLPAPMAVQTLPLHIFEDMLSLLIFVLRNDEDNVLFVVDMVPILTAMLYLGSSPFYVKNPYCRSSIVQIFAYFVEDPRNQNHKNLKMCELFTVPFVVRNLMSILIDLYIEVEATGSHTQFYDKFNIRHYIVVVMEHLWTMEGHRDSTRRKSEEEEQFLKFINRLMNDTIFLLDETLSALKKVNETQVLQADVAAWNALPVEERREREGHVQQNTSSVKMWIGGAVESLRMVTCLTAALPEPFLCDAMVNRMASTLNYLTDVLAGPKCSNLRVHNADEMGFHPIDMLKSIGMIYVHLAKDERFIEAIPRDERSYRPELLRRLQSILRKKMAVNDAVLSGLGAMAEACEKAGATFALEDDLGDVPDEFYDPIMATLMTDPVILPSSKVTVDRRVIAQHLLSDESDPFNRSSLTIDEVIPDVELKARIDEFIAAARAKKLAASVADATDGDAGGEAPTDAE